MELRESDKHIGKFVIVDLTPEAEKYIEDVQVDYYPFGKIENHACMVDADDKETIVNHLEKLKEYGLAISEGAAIAYEHWQRIAKMERIHNERIATAHQLYRIIVEGCAACEEFTRSCIGDGEYGFCRHCDCELCGNGTYRRDPATGIGRFVTMFVPDKNCKYFGGEKWKQ